MFITFIFTLALLGGTVAKLDKVHPSTMEIGSLASTVNADGEPVNFSGAVVIDGVSQANHLSMDCNNKFCNMWYYASVRITIFICGSKYFLTYCRELYL